MRIKEIKGLFESNIDKEYKRIADSFGLLYEYIIARQNGADPREALMEWDIWDYEEDKPYCKQKD